MTTRSTRTTPQNHDAIVVVDSGHAPVIYFDGAPNFGSNNGVVNITLAIARYLPDGQNGVATDFVATAHMRCSIQAAIDLKQAIDQALLLAAEPIGTAKN